MTLQHNVNAAVKCTFSYLQSAYFCSTSKWNADGKHCSKAYVTKFRLVTAEVAVPNGTALIAAWCNMSMTLQDITPQWNASDQVRICLMAKDMFSRHFTMERWWQTLQQCLCHWISSCHRRSSRIQWHGTHGRKWGWKSEIKARSERDQTLPKLHPSPFQITYSVLHSNMRLQTLLTSL